MPSNQVITPTNLKVSFVKIRAIYFNARSLRAKLCELHDILYNNLYNVICVSETWLDPKFVDGLLDPKHLFNIFRKDREGGCRGGGVCIFVDKRFITHSIDYSVDHVTEIVGCTIVLRSCSIRLICCYMMPNMSTINYRQTIKDLQAVCNSPCPSLLIGDFNAPNICWKSNHIPGDLKSQLLYNVCSELGLIQLINQPTRDSNLLDLLFTNDPSLLSNYAVSQPFGTSDHDSIIFDIYRHNRAASQSKRSNTNRGNRVLIWNETDWASFADMWAYTDWHKLFYNATGANV